MPFLIVQLPAFEAEGWPLLRESQFVVYRQTKNAGFVVAVDRGEKDNIHPADNEMVAAMIGNFQDGSIPGKIQIGSGWWFNDQLDGMRRQLEAVSQLGLLSRFVGMLTDSRSFLSFTRHEYFRRLLCRILGREIEEGLLPRDFTLVGSMTADICFRNARDYFRLGTPHPTP